MKTVIHFIWKKLPLRIELKTSALQVQCSTIELKEHNVYQGTIPHYTINIAHSLYIGKPTNNKLRILRILRIRSYFSNCYSDDFVRFIWFPLRHSRFTIVRYLNQLVRYTHRRIIPR